MKTITQLIKLLGPVASIAESAGDVLGEYIIKAVDAVFEAVETHNVDNH